MPFYDDTAPGESDPLHDVSLTPAEQRVAAALTHYFSPDELALLSADDIALFLEVECNLLPRVPASEALAAALFYRDYVRSKLDRRPRS